MNKTVLLLAAIATCGAVQGCSLLSSSGRQCRMWQSNGTVVSTLDSCVKCVDQLGENPDAVRGCAVGLDAASLINAGRPAAR